MLVQIQVIKKMDQLLDRNIYEAENKYTFWMIATTSFILYYFKVKLDELFLDFAVNI